MDRSVLQATAIPVHGHHFLPQIETRFIREQYRLPFEGSGTIMTTPSQTLTWDRTFNFTPVFDLTIFHAIGCVCFG
ncbi:hypothetical protein TNCV_1595351 [Trichonephila clavipes]|nr:hypothetical protein TNCV_1595351 [Trichonephila clavipes]